MNPRDESKEEIRHPSDDEPFCALAFKIMADPFVGKLAFFRVYSGKLESGSVIYNATKGKRERMGRILRMHANHREETDAVYAGDIAAVWACARRRRAIRSATKSTARAGKHGIP